MKKNKTIKSTNRSYKSVPELLEGEKSKIKLSPFNCKQVGLKREINCSSYKVNLLQSNTIKTLHERIDEQIPNQFIWCEEEKETYYYNEKRQLFKLKFEPIMTKKSKQTTEEYLESLDEAYLKKEIEALVVPWNKFYYVGRFSEIYYDTTALTRLLVDLLYTVKLEKIEIQCGIGMRCILDGYAKYDFIRKNIEIGDCVVKVKQNLNIGKFDLVYNDILLIGESIEEPVKEKCEVNKALKNLNETLDSCIDYLKLEETNKKSFWGRFKSWF